MCGLVGVAGEIGIKEERMFQTMLILDSLRGEDSVGVAALHQNGELSVVKKAINVYDFLDLGVFATMMRRKNTILMGHNRAATKGKVNSNNAHPFEFDTLVGAHNGTLRGQHRLKDAKNFEVDSENIFYHLEEEGVTDLYSKLDGAAALTWINMEERSINFLRNSEREFNVCTSKDGKTFFWASEKWMMIVAASKFGVELNEESMKATPIHTHITIKLADGKVDVTANKLEPFVAPVYTPAKSYYSQGASKVLLKKEGKSVGEFINFSVDSVKGFGLKSNHDVIGTTDKGSMVKLFGVRDEKRIKLLSESPYMFKAKISSEYEFNSMKYLILQEETLEEVVVHEAPK